MWFRTIMTRRIIIYTNERRNPEWVCPFETLTQLYTSQSPTHAHSVTILQCTPHPFFTIVRWPKKNYNNFLVWQTQVIIIIFEKLFRSDRPPRYPIFQFDWTLKPHNEIYVNGCVCCVAKEEKLVSNKAMMAVRGHKMHSIFPIRSKCIQSFRDNVVNLCVCVLPKTV